MHSEFASTVSLRRQGPASTGAYVDSVPPMAEPTVVFFHAHPDDEAIFTGGTMARLAASGVRVVVVLATLGGLGDAGLGNVDELAELRLAEAKRSCEILAVDQLHLLGYADSGMSDQTVPSGAFAVANIYEAAEKLAVILRREQATALVHYDEGGIYGHSDHLGVHRVGKRAAALVDLATVYEATVDHEHLHFVETHLVGHAVASLHETAVAGVPTALVSTTLDVSSVIDAKRRAMAAHQSQIGPESEVMQFSPEIFEAVYGHEWYLRHGEPGLLEALAL